MIVRESPRRAREAHTDVSWPPRSPRDALLSSPSRQRKLQYDHSRISISPSPMKRRPQHSAKVPGEDDHLSEEDDEETLQLKLAQIEARLRLKKLQKSKAAKENISPDVSPRRSKSLVSLPESRIEIPVSPVKKAQPSLPASPRRVQLGIDKGLRASDVSLKRPASDRSLHARQQAQARRDPLPAVKSFSERLAEARGKDETRANNQERFNENRSRGFGVQNPIRATHGQGASSSSTLPRSLSQSSSQKLRPARSKSLTDFKHASSHDTDEDTDLDPFSGFRLSRRHLNHSVLEQAFDQKTMYPLPRLLKEVVSPNYEPPDIESDYVVFGIVAFKSNPKHHAETHRQTSTADPDDASNQRTKFMVMRLTDLKWELDLFLFDTGFDTFWKIPEGSIIAILNPAIMPPKPHLRDTGKFSLKLSSSEDTVLEIGTAKDLGWCKSIKKDGQQCSAWVNARKTEHCDFHINLRFEKDRASRPEVNSMAGLSMFGQKGKGSAKRSNGSAGFGKSDKFKDNGLRHEGLFHDWEAHENAYSVPKELRLGISAARRFDVDDYVRGSQKERDQKRQALKDNEKKLLKQLTTQGSGPGRDYARQRRGDDDDDEDIFLQSAAFERDSKDLTTLGLLDKKAADVRMSSASAANSSKQPMGWSGAYKRGLLEPTRGLSPERKVQRTSKKPESPSKQARFMLDKKGLRHPGRESLGKSQLDDHNDDDDDGLEIV